MDKKHVVATLEEIAVLLELSGENPFKSRSYVNVARSLEQTEEDIDVLVREKRLREIKGVGDALEQKIEELVDTGRLEYYEELKSKFPPTLFDLFRIPGLGAKRIKVLYDDLKVTSLEELVAACRDNRVRDIKGFGQKTQDNILEGIAFTRQSQGLHLLDKAWREADRLMALLSQEKDIIRIEVAGSLRRRKEIIKDIDILVSCKDPAGVMKRFVEAPGVTTVYGHGDTKSSVLLDSGIQADLRVVSDEQFPYALCYFTGSKEHNVVMRQRAKDRNLKLNEYGLFDGEKSIPCATELDIFGALGLPYIPPELREDRGEFEAQHAPQLVERTDLRGVIHVHSTYSDGAASIEQMAVAARERGYSWLVMADHSQSAAYAGGLQPARVQKQHNEIDALNKKLDGIRILKGIESDIRSDGSLDYDDNTLGSFECVIASVHSKLNMTEDEATARVIKAIENPHTAILGHPTGRLLLSREGYPLNYADVFDACLANHVAVEINANCHRLDLDWRYIRRAKDKGLMFSIGPDAHNVDGLDDVRYGLGLARKGWLEAENLLNCMTVEEFMKWRKSR